MSEESTLEEIETVDQVEAETPRKQRAKKEKDERIDQFYALLGARISAVRVARGMTQEALAKATNFAAPSICSIEKGRQRPPVFVVFRIAEGLGLAPADASRLLPVFTPNGIDDREGFPEFISRISVVKEEAPAQSLVEKLAEENSRLAREAGIPDAVEKLEEQYREQMPAEALSVADFVPFDPAAETGSPTKPWEIGPLEENPDWIFDDSPRCRECRSILSKTDQEFGICSACDKKQAQAVDVVDIRRAQAGEPCGLCGRELEENAPVRTIRKGDGGESEYGPCCAHLFESE